MTVSQKGLFFTNNYGLLPHLIFLSALLQQAATSATSKHLHSTLFPNVFKSNMTLDVMVGRLNSIKTHIPFDYYFLSYCAPENLFFESSGVGDALTGDNRASTPFKVSKGYSESLKQIDMMQNKEHEVICNKTFQSQQYENFKWMIERDYAYSFYVDDLPSAYVTRHDNMATIKYQNGIPVGYVNNVTNDIYIYNHLDLTIQVHETLDDKEAFKIVGFRVEPKSMKHSEIINPSVSCGSTKKQQELKMNDTITFSYSVHFEKSEIEWASRWDHYLQMGEDRVHWMAIGNSVMIVLCLAGLIAHIMSRALKRDISQYEQMRIRQQSQLKKSTQAKYATVQSSSDTSISVDEESKEESAVPLDTLDEIAWKKVKGEVFKRPKHHMLFSIFIGTGIQILTMFVFFLLFAVVGIISPQHRGTAITALYFIFIFLSNLSGYYSARYYKMFLGQNWIANAMLTSMMYPCLIFVTFFLVNISTFLEQSSSATLSVPKVLVLLIIYCMLSIPNVWLGSFIGFKRPTIKNPGKVNKLSRDVPSQPWYLRMKILVPIGGILPFAAVFIEFLYLMSSIWRSQVYYMFGFLFLIVIILIITSAEVAIVQTYFQLCAENYHWWWRSFMIGASSGLYLLIFSFYYFFFQTNITRFSSGVIYFSVMFLISVSFALMTGAIGFLASFSFNRRIYSLIKSD